MPGEPFEGRIFVPAGNFEGDPGIRPDSHIFVASKAPWYEIADDLPRFDAYPPGVEAPELPARAPIDPPGHTRGSCLCGAVAFVVEGEVAGCRNCHCSRCRKARSAAHASNLFTRTDGVRFARGEELLSEYRIPEARFFTQAFCQKCGSPMPRRDPTRGRALVPMGALDDDPGVRPSCHIFVDSKAPWFAIADRLPQHAEYPPEA